ncbi:hypothetical protein BASA81_015182 [Batrachochytrium salamandrivorans]|nr:hypothetical protein BASA81_015182 [Batrachochytrium salamandrivorans]
MELKLTRISTYEIKLVLEQVPEYHSTFKTASEYRDLMSLVNAVAPPPIPSLNNKTKKRVEGDEDDDAFSARDVLDLDCEIVTRMNM